MAQLVLHANRVVSAERLVDAVWGLGAPQTARTQIQICVSRLRRVLGAAGLADRIATVDPGYRLVADPDEVDLLVFDREVSATLHTIRQCTDIVDVAACVAIARSALGLFTGEPMADVSSEVVQARARQISQRRLHVLTACLEAQIAHGHAADVIDEIAVLITEHPLNGRLRGVYMKALQRLGRRADALAAYHDAFLEYRERLGVGPDPELRQLNETILRDMSHENEAVDEAVAARPGVVPFAEKPAQPHGILLKPTLNRVLVPVTKTHHSEVRPEEFRRLRRFLSAKHTPGPCPVDGPVIVSVSGPRGLCKTHFAISAAVELASDFPDGQLYQSLRAGSGRAAGLDAVLAALLRTLGVPDVAVPRLLDERLALYGSLLNGRRCLLILDNAIDDRQLIPLLPRGRDNAVIVISRLPWGSSLATHRLQLGHLGTDASLRFLAQLVGAERVMAEPEAAKELAELCAGVPFALVALAWRLNQRPGWPLARCARFLRDESTLLDRLCLEAFDVRGSLRADYDELSPPAQLLLRRLAPWGRRCFSPAVVDDLLDPEEGAGAEAIDELVEMRIVEVCPEGDSGPERYRSVGLTRLLVLEPPLSEELLPGPALGEFAAAGHTGLLPLTDSCLCPVPAGDD